MKAKNYTPHSKLMKNLRRLNQIRKGIKKTGFPDMDAQVSNDEKCKDCIKNMNYT